MIEPRGTRGQSSLIGVVLVLGVSVLVAGVAVAIAAGAIGDLSRSVAVKSTGEAMAELDRQASLVALGNADVRTVEFGRLREGRIAVREDAGWIRVTHNDYDGSADEVLLNRTLGAVVYENRETEIAYQAGGVWRSDGSGSVVVAPPEVHYRDQTLTLGVLQIRGDASATGDVELSLRARFTDRTLFPAASRTYPDGDAYRNPIERGNVTITVRSEYREAWAEFFRERTTAGAVERHADNGTVTVDLTTTGTIGDFAMPASGSAIDLRGLPEGHAIRDFSFTIYPDPDDSAHFANLDWSLSATSGPREFSIELGGQGKPCNGGEVDVTLRYDGPNTTKQVWRRTDAFSENATAFSYDCSGEDPTLSVNLTGTTTLTYRSGPDPASFDHADHGEPEDFSPGQDASIDQLTNHYVALLDSNVEFEVQDGVGNGNGNSASGSVDESRSFGTLDYEQSDVVSYLHVTANGIEIAVT